MGQEQNYLNYGTWSPDLTHEERVARGPFQSSFAVGRAENAAAAVESARRRALFAESIFELVQEQAVFALAVEGATVREIEERSGVTKSQASRILRRHGRDEGGRPSNIGHAFGGDLEKVRSAVRSCWDDK